MTERGPLRLGVLVSGSGSNLQAMIDARAQGRLEAEITLVLSNRPKAYALERARAAGLATAVVSHRRFADRASFEDALVAELRAAKVEWIALAGFMRVLTSRFLSAFPQRVLNIHPALLPAFPGVDAQRQALEHGVKVTGCTVHLVDEGMDTGPILAQVPVPVLDDDDAETLAARILAEEHRIYPAVLQRIACEGVVLDGRRARFVASRC